MYILFELYVYKHDNICMCIGVVGVGGGGVVLLNIVSKSILQLKIYKHT